jgi:hypothetical protein
MLRFKPEVRIVHFTAQLHEVLALATLWSLIVRVDVEVNSIDDGAPIHMSGSLHGKSLAVDLDTVGDKPADTAALGERMRVSLPPQYDVVFEGDHVHIEWDAHRGPLVKKVTT